MPRIDNLIQFIVPLTFLAIWALTSLFNREAQPLPPRTGRPFGPDGPRPGEFPGQARPPIRPVEGRAPNPVPQWARQTSLDRPQGRRSPVGGDDDIVILESETRRPASPPPSKASGSVSPRRSARGKPAATPAPKKAEPATPRALSKSVHSEAAMTLSQHMALNPLTKSQAPLLPHEVIESGQSNRLPPHSAAHPTMSGTAFALTTITPAKLREAILLSEIIQPPLSLRGRRTRRI